MDLDDDWPRRLDCERRAGNISGDRARVLLELWRCCIRGDDMPSEARLADLAGVKRSTVQRAKQDGRALGLLDWDRVRHYVGNLRRDKPCSYRVQMPAASVIRRKHQIDARVGSKAKGSVLTRSIKQQMTALPPITVELQALWAARRAKYEGLRR